MTEIDLYLEMKGWLQHGEGAGGEETPSGRMCCLGMKTVAGYQRTGECGKEKE